MQNNILEVKNLTKKFGDFTAVDNISFSLKEGEILGLLGPNGAGKTTTIHMLLGVLLPTYGQVVYFGKNFEKNREEILFQVNFASTYISLPRTFQIYEILEVYARLYEVKNLGFIVSALIIRFGHTIQALAWVGLSILAPFSAIYYPVSILPKWMQYISLLLPPTYIFEGMREIINKGSLLPEKLFTSFVLNIIYLILSIWFFIFMFNKSRKLGLGRLI